MEQLRAGLLILHILAMVTLVGGLLWLTLLEKVHGTRRHEEFVALDRALHTTGNVQGVTLATVIFSGLALYYLQAGAFSWRWGSHAEQLAVLKMLAFGVFWVTWGWVEVVEFHGLRVFMPAVGDAPSPEFMAARRRAWRAVHLLLAEAVVVLVLGVLGRLAT